MSTFSRDAAASSHSRQPSDVLQQDNAYDPMVAESDGNALNNPNLLLNDLSAEKKQKKDGQPPKRRGPKPDSKPALTRRQELNRQAQRTHRERKEMYIKALEQEVLRIKEVYTQTARERDAVAEENRRLKELLSQHGISYDFSTTSAGFKHDNPGFGASSSGSFSSNYQATSDSNTRSPGGQVPGAQQGRQAIAPNQMHHMAQLPSDRLDYDQIGIDFVLTYDSQGRPIYPAPYPSPPPQH